MVRRLWLVLIVGALLAASGLTEPTALTLAAASSVLAQDPGGGAGDNGGGNVDGGPSKKEESQGGGSSGGGQTPAPAADPKPKEEPQGGAAKPSEPQPTNAPAPRPTNEPASGPQPTAAPKATPQPEPGPGVAPKPTEPARPGAGTPPNAVQPSVPAGAPAGPTPTNAPGAPTTAPAAPLPGEEPALGQNGCRIGTDGCEPAPPPVPEPGSSVCAAGSPECENSGSASTAQNLKTLGHAALDGLGMAPGVGAFADGANALWYAAEGDWINAGISGASAMPFAGDALGAVKIAKNAPEAAEAGASLLTKGKELFGGAHDWFGRAKDKLFGGGKPPDEPPRQFGPGATHKDEPRGGNQDPYGGREPGTPPAKQPGEPSDSKTFTDPHENAPGTGRKPDDASAGSYHPEDVDRAAKHLERLDPDPRNEAMLGRIRENMKNGRELSPNQKNFMRHELREAELMDKGADYESAHSEALKLHPEGQNYDPEVMEQMPEYFNNWWRTRNGLPPR